MAQQQFQLLQKKLKEARQNFFQQAREDVPGLLAAKTYAQNLIDNIGLATRDWGVAKPEWALIAVGGFGRGELSPVSDLDLLFLHRTRIPGQVQETFKALMYSLWDAGFEVGQTTASLSENRSLVQEDFTVLTNLLEPAFISGNLSFFESWRKSFLEALARVNRKRFVRKLFANREERLTKYGESAYLLEPHIKEGVGGMRDVQTLRWAAVALLGDPSPALMVERELLSAQELHWIEQAYDFLWRVRIQAHQLCGRRQDRLLFPEQEQIATRFGFQQGPRSSAVEAFMRQYYRNTSRVRRTTSFVLERIEEAQSRATSMRPKRRVLPGPFLLDGSHIRFMDPEWVAEDPRLLMRFFRQAAKTGAHFHHHAGIVIRDNLSLVDDRMRSDPQCVGDFFKILLDPKNAFQVLGAMMETGFLETFVPEFAAVRYRVQHDVYHLFTVDEHLLRTVRQLHRMEGGSHETVSGLDLRDNFARCKSRRVLYLAALLHDIGKGFGKNHAARGARLAEDIGPRFGLDERERALLKFLIENHLLLAETALKRDLSDEKPLLSCAAEIEDSERLHMLYLLTIADSISTGPGAWNKWKASLLKELVNKLDRLLTGEWRGENLRSRTEEVMMMVLELAPSDEETRNSLSAWLNNVSIRYLISRSPEEILTHFEMERSLEERNIAMSLTPAEGDMWQMAVATRDRPGLFADLTGVLWARGLNILSADIFTTGSGVALDVFMIDTVPDPLRSEELWARVERDLSRVMSDPGVLSELIAEKRKPSLLGSKCLPRKNDRVLVDEDASDFYTIVEVYTWDRPGILHAISSTLSDLGMNIRLARISTPGAQVVDVFYITDVSGEKLMDYDVHENLREKLLASLVSVC